MYKRQGLKRFRIQSWLSETPPYHAQVEYLNEEDEAGVEELRAYSLAIINTLKELLSLIHIYQDYNEAELAMALSGLPSVADA